MRYSLLKRTLRDNPRLLNAVSLQGIWLLEGHDDDHGNNSTDTQSAHAVA